MITETAVLAVEDSRSAVSWKAIFAGATAAVALTLLLVAFGVGVGFSVISPWSDSGISATAFTIAGGVYLIVVAMLSSTIGGYLAGRLRTQWQTVHAHERYFRDSAHGFLVWAVATVVTVAFLGGAMSNILGAAGGGAAAIAKSNATDGYVDSLLRSGPMTVPAPAAAAPAPAQSPQQANQQATEQATSPVATDQTVPPLQGGQVTTVTASRPANDASRGEVGRLIAPVLIKGGTIDATDRTYLVRLIASRTGLTEAEADKRVDAVVTKAKTAADAARKSTAAFALWLVVSMLAGALSAALAAIEGGNLRNREWYLTAR